MADETFPFWVNTILGTPDDDDFDVLGGANTVDMSQGGNDTLSISAYVNTVVMGDGWDTVTTENFAGIGSIDLGGGRNILDASDGGYIGSVEGGHGRDIVSIGNSGAGSVNLGAGRDVLDTTGFVNTIDTGANADEVTLLAGANTVSLGGQDDLLITNAFVGTVNAGGGIDTILLGAGANLVNLGPGSDMFVGTAWVGQVNGGQGRDEIAFEAGGVAFGNRGRDTFIHGDGSDNFYGNSQPDTFEFDADTAGAYDFIDGGGSNQDTLNISVILDPGLADDIRDELDGWVSGDPIFISSLNLQVTNVEFINVFEAIV